MSGSILGKIIRDNLLSGSLTAGTLQTALGDADNLAAFKLLVNSVRSIKTLISDSTAITAIAGSALAIGVVAQSDYATTQICRNSNALKTILTTATSLTAYTGNSSNNARLKNQVNKGASKLKRQIFTSSGTFTAPSAGMAARLILLIGAGGCGSVSQSTNTIGGGGGGGGETKVLYEPSPANTSVSITIGAAGETQEANGGNTIAGALLTALGGSGANDTVGGVGGGTTTNSGRTNLNDTDILNAVWPSLVSFAQKGGDGGDGTTGTGESGEQGLTGAGGGQHLAGTGYGSGGGGGGTGNVQGENGIVNSGCGSGGDDKTNDTEALTSGSGLGIFYYIEN